LGSRVLGGRGPRFIGTISYGVFLWQFVVGYAFFAALRLKTAAHGGSYTGIETAGIMAAVALLTTAAATASYYLIEHPARRLRSPWPHHDRTGRSGPGEDESGRQPADDDQADDLGDRVPQPGHDQAGTPSP
jgi:peptidoglycan/LPS O-acetylase OafA/YrhL